MNPKHISKVSNDRAAVAPYNFVELPNKVVEAEELPSGDRYYPDRHTGRIECTLTTESPLYIRCGLTTEEFQADKEAKDLPDFFYTDPASKSEKPVLPGSSLRGMLRTLVEIVSFSKIDRVSDAQKFFFRAVAAEANDPLKQEYKKYVNPEKIKAGYLVENQVGWSIRPAELVDNDPFVWVKEDEVKSIPNYVPMDNLSEYRPQYFINISFEDIVTKNSRRFAGKVSSNCTQYQYTGVIVTAGNMLEGGTNPADLKRRNHCIVREPDPGAQLIPISDDAIRDYCSALTPFQKQELPFDKSRGVLKKGRCIFYCQPQNGQPVTLFGQSPNFRIPYSPGCNGKASTARDFIPPFLKDSLDKPATTDIGEAIFGFVRRYKQPEGKNQSQAGRVFITDGVLKQNQEEKVRSSLDKNPVLILLATPKPTTFQHYLVQKDATQRNLRHYASKPPTNTEQEETPGETVIRGHKLYWHKPAHIEVPSDASDTQTSLIKPIDSGIEFTFTIHFENLSKVELGALLWVLSLSSDKSQTLETGKQNEKCCFSLGMGKPLGMGAVKIDYELHLSDRKKRYENLFSTTTTGWETGEEDPSKTAEKEKESVKVFEEFMLGEKTGICEDDHLNGRRAVSLKEVPRIEMLLAMLRCDKTPETDQLKYMELDDFRNRKVLLTPLDLMKISDNRRHDRANPSPANTRGTTEKPKKQPEPLTNLSKRRSEGGGSVNQAMARPQKPPKP